MGNTKKRRKKSSRNMIAVIAVCLVCAIGVGGTIAWLTSTSTLDNKFTVGMIKPIDPSKPGPGGGDIPEDDKKPDAQKLSGNLYEPSWVKDSKLLPGITVKKDPYVGVGPDSEKSYVYVYVKNSMANNDHIYFTIEEGWSPVTGETTVVDGDNEGDQGAKYTGGLFKYDAGLTGADGVNVWTTKPLFEKVSVSEDAEAKDFVLSTINAPKLDGTDELGSIKVQSFVHQMNNAEGTPLNEQTIVIPAAKKAFGITL